MAVNVFSPPDNKLILVSFFPGGLANISKPTTKRSNLVSNEFKKKLDKLKRKQSETAIKFINTNQNKISAGLGLKISMDFIVSIVVGVLIWIQRAQNKSLIEEA